MTKMEVRVERRKHKRFKVEGAYVAFGPLYTAVGPVLDVSRGGLGLAYMATKKAHEKPSQLEIFLPDSDFHLEEVPFETVFDFELRKLRYGSMVMRRRGVKFRELTQNQISELEYFIKKYAIGEV